MNNNQVQQALMGAALVALGYALWTRFAPAKAARQTVATQSGTPYNPANPGALTGIASLLAGTVHDIYAGDTSSYATPTTSQIFADVTGYDPQTNYFASAQDRGYLA